MTYNGTKVEFRSAGSTKMNLSLDQTKLNRNPSSHLRWNVQ